MKKIDQSISQLYSKDSSQFTYFTVTDRLKIEAGKDGVTEEWIQLLKELHRVERNDIRAEEQLVNLDTIEYLVGDKCDFLADNSNSPEDIILHNFESTELHARLNAALHTLSKPHLELFIQVRIRHKSIASIARSEGVHESSVRERLHRVEKKLRNLLSTPPEFP